MTHRNTRSWIITAALTTLVLSGCHVVLGPDDGEQEWWYYCDESGCYECDRHGCNIPGSYCYADADCPPSLYCDMSTNTCRTKTKCQVTADCGFGNICTNGKCVPGRTPCTDHESCGDGAYCSNGVCKDSKLCANDSDCAALGNFICESGTCVPGKPVQGCTSAAGCADGLCVDGKCGTCAGDCGGGNTCQFNNHCGDKRACLDAKCTNTCSADSDCATGQACKSAVCVAKQGSCVANTDCSSGEVCVNNTCHENCTTSDTCTNSADTCSPAISLEATSVKVCVPDNSAQTECKVSKDCVGGEVCVNGVCRTSCETSTDCAACDDGPVCGQGGFCMTAKEADPKCKLSSDCTGDLVCLDAQCVSL